MSVTRDVIHRLDRIEASLGIIDQHLHTIIRMQNTMSDTLDRLTAAVDANGVATDALSDEVTVAIDYIKSHPAVTDDPELLALAMRLEDKNAKAVEAKDALTAAVNTVSSSGGLATP
jgi:hypothetical protein